MANMRKSMPGVVVLWWWICCCCFVSGFSPLRINSLTSPVWWDRKWSIGWQPNKPPYVVNPSHQCINISRVIGTLLATSRLEGFFVVVILVSAILSEQQKSRNVFFWLSRVFRSKLTQKSMTFLHEKPVESAKAVFLAFELTAGPHSLLLYDLPAPWLFAVKMGGFWALKTPTLSEYNGKFQNAWSGWFGASSCMQEKFLCFGPSPFWSIVYSVVVVLVVLVRRITRMKHIIIP